MNSYNYRDIFWNGFWRQNTGLAQLLGLCPILAVSTSVVNGVSLAIATIVVMAMSNAVVSALRNLIPYEIRIPVFILIIAALVTVLDLAMNAWLHELYMVLGIFVPLITTNCIVLARVEAYAAKNPALPSAVDGAAMGVGLMLVLAVLGGMRELIGTGQLFAGIEMIIPGAHAVQVLPADYPGFLFAILPPGAFIALACLIAGKSWLEARNKAAQTSTGAGCVPAAH
ncbi:electron transport complex subunit E [Uliginosibacterium aquaticum]|uniref:Ion-translocating oxidoreductase complex subunit E n=1 Tax=Uliginosibacterium aquaticum TaxID=2731212 RepID=A0ABX2IMD8_9RHOO|nr:electron transport complex subunit E [Uliginosibacterium aquaticum]NSL55195.1 electron transport complex subunit E [Uliginosibacterium aquaticum]